MASSTDPRMTAQEMSGLEPLNEQQDRMVGDKLRRYFDALADTGVPDRIVELILKLSEKEAAKGAEENK